LLALPTTQLGQQHHTKDKKSTLMKDGLTFFQNEFSRIDIGKKKRWEKVRKSRYDSKNYQLQEKRKNDR
jgi:hypothetical protein